MTTIYEWTPDTISVYSERPVNGKGKLIGHFSPSQAEHLGKQIVDRGSWIWTQLYRLPNGTFALAELHHVERDSYTCFAVLVDRREVVERAREESWIRPPSDMLDEVGLIDFAAKPTRRDSQDTSEQVDSDKPQHAIKTEMSDQSVQGAPLTQSAVTGDEQENELSLRQLDILQTMLAKEITSHRRRKFQAAIVLLINSTHNSSSYSRDFAELVKIGYLESREGPRGGMWVNFKRKEEIAKLLNDAPQLK